MAYDRNEVQAYITEAARRRGIDPNTALRVIKQESGFNPMATNLSPKEKSYGLMQLNTQGGLGVHALEKGIDIRNPETWRQQVDFGLDVVAKDGWRQWYGARDVGIGRWDGIGGRPASAPVGPGAQPKASPLTEAMAERGGSGSTTLAGGAGGDQIATGGAGPAVNIGLAPERSTKSYDDMLKSAMDSGAKAKNGWDVAGSLAQVWAANSEKKEAEAENASALQKALAAANLDPSYAMVALLSGGREGAASAILAQQSDRAQAANRAEQRSDRLAAQEYQQEQDRLDNARADKTLELQVTKANAAPEAPSSVREYEYAKSQGFSGSYQDWETQNRKAGASMVNVGGGENKQVFDAVAERATAARAAATGLNGLAEAKKALDSGIISGAGADTVLGLQKIGAALGVVDPATIQNTETFRSAIAPQVAAMVKATVGSANISNSDREFAEKAAGGNITLDAGSIKRLVGIMDTASRAVIKGHRDTLEKVYPAGGAFERERALFDVAEPAPLQEAPASGPSLVPGSDGGGVQPRRTKRGVTWSVE